VDEGIQFKGTYFDGKTSKAYPVTLRVAGEDLILEDAADSFSIAIPLKNCVITPPLGRSSRSLKFPSGGKCDIHDLGAAATLEKNLGINYGMRLVNFLEGRWKPATACFICLIFCVWGFVRFGIPFVATIAANAVPLELVEHISSKSLAMLDKRYLLPSRLKKEKIEEVRTIFQKYCASLYKNVQYRVEVRRGNIIGPNAFALPSGIILITDELVELIESEKELAAVLFHEMAHVRHRHGLRSVFQNAGVFLVISALAGDIASITSTAATLPTLLAESGYSRKFEFEADREAGMYCIRKGWGTKPYQDILLRMSQNELNFPGKTFLSSHPLIEERITYLRDLQQPHNESM